MLGDLGHTSDGRHTLTFTRKLNHPPEKVWRALTEPQHVGRWFPADIEGERRAGAQLKFVFREDEGPTLPGEMLTYDPPRVLAFSWDDELLHFELEPDGRGTVLTFVNTFGDLGKAARDAAGWDSCLGLLELRLDGVEPDEAAKNRWQAVHDSYVRKFPPEAATVGPPQVG